MNTLEWAKKKLENKGWIVSKIEYERPHTGFKCIDGGYICILDTDERHWDILEINEDAIFGSVSNNGIIMALYKHDFKALVNKIPTNPIPKTDDDKDSIIENLNIMWLKSISDE